MGEQGGAQGKSTDKQVTEYEPLLMVLILRVSRY